MRKIIFELCAETMDACLAAQPGGASRIELCSGLSEGGMTPSHAFIREAVRRSGLPVHVLIRPRGGNYVYSAAEMEVMEEDIRHAKSLGAAGVVLGLLHADATVDVAATTRLVELAQPMEVTFHRAFDSTPSLELALEQVIQAGCKRVLTSGGERDVVEGAEVLGALVRQAAGRIEIAVGGGLRQENAANLVRVTGATHFHGSLQSRPSKHATARPGTSRGEESGVENIVPDTVRTMVRLLEGA